MLPTRDPPQDKRPTQTESEGLETSTPSKWTGKKSHKKKPRRSLHNTQGKNPTRRQKHCKYICTQHRSTQIYKENLG